MDETQEQALQREETGGAEAAGLPEEAGPAAPGRTPFKPLFFAALLLAGLLAGGCGWLALRAWDSAQQEFRLHGQLDQELAAASQLRQELEQARAGLTAAQGELAQVQEELARAQDTIDLLEEYSVATPEGVVPEYTQLYPDFYAPDWEGERVTGGQVCCLTFDDGPSANTDRILAVLERYGVKATFFVVGRTGQADQERMRRIVEGGHTLAMHSWSHDYKTVYASVEGFLEEFYQLYQWIYEDTGTYPQLFRFPGGSINGYNRGVYQEIIGEMTRRGFVYFDWNASAQDATVTPLAPSVIAAGCLKGVGKELVVVLAHDSAPRGTTVDALPAVIEGYQAAGYTFSPLHPGVTPVTMGYPRAK